MNIRLKLLIIALYGNQSNFAKECGRSENWVSRIITGRQKLSPKEKEKIGQLLKNKKY